MPTFSHIPVADSVLEDAPQPWRFSPQGDPSIDQLLAGLRRHGEPRRGDLLTLEQLRHHARQLAGRQTLATRPGRDRLLGRLQENARILEEMCRVLRVASAGGCVLAPAAAWLVDNYYFIAQQIRLARQHLPRKYSRSLPQRAGGANSGMPRVYELALELITHVDGQLDQENLSQFIRAYQPACPLKLGELWAIPIMLRLALVENLRCVALRVAAQLADAMDQDGAADLVSASNSILSLRTLEALDWRQFVEGQSAVERILRQDPEGSYKGMDFASRDRYRHVVELLAQRSPLSEEQVAQAAVKLARRSIRSAVGPLAPAGVGEARKDCHVGYYLVDRGRAALESGIAYRRTAREAVARWMQCAPLGCYLGAVGLVWLLTVTLAAAAGWKLGAGSAAAPGVCLLLMVLFSGAATQLALSVVNWLCTSIVPPRPMMRLDFSAGIPREYRTLVAIPAMLSGPDALRAMVERLEIRYLANRDENLLFALLTDLPDADRETLPGDEALLASARTEIGRLNRRYCGGGKEGDRSMFFLLHRPRKWNPQEGAWMGEERKRGKLAALNGLLCSAAADAFSVTAGDLARLAGVRYVIVLDTDTWLPRDVGRQLVACMAHPLNRARVDTATRLVVEGHAILQPRVGTTMPEATRSLFSRWFAGAAGIDPYTQQTSDLYHDLFGQGSFIGKGIYDVRAFEASLHGRFPANRVLSHDLIEGCFARSGFINDVELFEGHPSRLLADMSRRHRWIRGDWQIAAWLRRRVPAASRTAANPLSWLSWWKIVDNLRRSLWPIFLLGFLLLGWSLAPALAGYWALLALAITFLPPLLGCLGGLFRKPEEQPWNLTVKQQAGRCLAVLLREAIAWCLLPYTAHCHGDAIVRTLFRLHVSGRKLLEWTLACDAELRCQGGCRHHYKVMWSGPACGLGMAAWLAMVRPAALLLVGPLLLGWLAAPLLAWWISRPCRGELIRWKQSESRQLRHWARRTWHYFDIFVDARNSWLPPDNVHEHPRPLVTARTSPTNIGMALLADLAACDLGYLPAAAFVQRIARTLAAMQRLERHRGHFFNWYDTATLKAIEPRYISSVDSGNLWGSLQVLGGGLAELRDRPLVGPRLIEGLQDTIEVIAALWASAGHGTDIASGTRRFDDLLQSLREACDAPSRSGTGAASGTSARHAAAMLAPIVALAEDLVACSPAETPILRQWARCLLDQGTAAQQELLQLAFWTRVIPLADPCPAALAAGEREALEALQAGMDRLDTEGCSLRQLPEAAGQVAARAAWLLDAAAENGRAGDELRCWLAAIRDAAEEAAAAARDQLQQLSAASNVCRQFSAMDFRFLFHAGKKQLAVGYNARQQRLDNSFYDLLASESRLTSFLAVSHGQLPAEHWFALGRLITLSGGAPVLLSWSGSMFEYLMPMLIMPSYRGTLLDASCRAAVRRQIRYGRRRGVPWGISESVYHQLDAERVYQYQAFGVPGLGLQRGLGRHLVVAPYASALALLVAPRQACRNLARLERLGMLSPYGFYDAIDYTPQRRLPGGAAAPCRTVMAHHSGMTLLALAGALLGRRMPQRFLSDPASQAHDLLLQERVPQAMRPADPAMLESEPGGVMADCTK